MLRGMATVTFWAEDVVAARDWYAELLDEEAYFERVGPEGNAAYVEFRLGDYQHELGIADRRYAPADTPREPGGAVVHWHVDDVRAALDRLLARGAREHEPLTERGAGFVTASVVDPFGNVLGVMDNPHYVDVLNRIPSFELPRPEPDLIPDPE
ncbi:VOC family protein [Streptomyces sparsus]